MTTPFATYTTPDGRKVELASLEPGDIPGTIRCRTMDGQSIVVARDMEAYGRLVRRKPENGKDSTL